MPREGASRRRRAQRALAALACAGATGACATAPALRRGERPAGASGAAFVPLEGQFQCYFSRQGVDAPRAPCRVARATGGAWRLEGGGGTSPRVSGGLRPLDRHRLRFAGSLFREPDAAAEPAAGDLEVVDVHVYRGALATARGPLWVTIAYVPTPGPRGVEIP